MNVETLLAAGAPRALLAGPLQRGGHGRRPRLGRQVEPLLAAAAARRAVVPLLHLLGQQREHLATRGGDLVGDVAQRARIPSNLAPVDTYKMDDLDKVQGSLPGQGDGEEDEAGGCGHDGGLGWSELSPSHRYLLSVLKPEIWARDYIKQYLETLAFNIAYYETKASQKSWSVHII